jgi:hypothetical protein
VVTCSFERTFVGSLLVAMFQRIGSDYVAASLHLFIF